MLISYNKFIAHTSKILFINHLNNFYLFFGYFFLLDLLTILSLYFNHLPVITSKKHFNVFFCSLILSFYVKRFFCFAFFVFLSLSSLITSCAYYTNNNNKWKECVAKETWKQQCCMQLDCVCFTCSFLFLFTCTTTFCILDRDARQIFSKIDNLTINNQMSFQKLLFVATFYNMMRKTTFQKF